MKKKPFLIGAAVLSAVALLGTGGYIAKGLVEYSSIEAACPGVNVRAESYDGSDVEVPEEFRELSVKGVDFEAPDGLYWRFPEETEGVKSGILVNGEMEEPDYLGILVLDPDSPESAENEFISKRWQRNLKRLGYKIPENDYEVMELIYSIDLSDCNKFSPSQVRAFRELAFYKEVMLSISDTEKVYKTENEDFYILMRLSYDGECYDLTADCYEKASPNTIHTVVIKTKDAVQAEQIAKTLRLAEDQYEKGIS